MAVAKVRWSLGYGKTGTKEQAKRDRASRYTEQELFGLSEQIEMLRIPGAEALASFAGFYKVILYVMYYPCAFITGLFWSVSGHGGDMAFFQGVLNGEMPYTFSNYLQWDEAPKYICAIVLVKLAMKTVGSIGRRGFKGLLQTAYLTLAAAMFGSLAGMFYIWMQETARGSFLLTVLFLIPSFAVYLIFPYTAFYLILPLILISMPVIMLILQPVILFAAPMGAGLSKSVLHRMQIEAFVKGDMLTHKALVQAEQGKLGPLLLLEILDM